MAGTQTALSDEFTGMFRDEHRQVRDVLLDLIEAIQARDRMRSRSLLARVAELTGPHFRYEEEALYPGLVGIFGEEYIEKLLRDHDAAIGTAKRLVELTGQDALSDGEVEKALGYVRSILPHVSDCDGLSIMVERFPEDRVREIFDARERALDANLDLLQWADHVRARAAILPD